MNLLRQQMESSINFCVHRYQTQHAGTHSVLSQVSIDWFWRNATAGMHYACSTMLYGNGTCTASDYSCNHPVIMIICNPVPDCIDDDVQHTFSTQLTFGVRTVYETHVYWHAAYVRGFSR